MHARTQTATTDPRGDSQKCGSQIHAAYWNQPGPEFTVGCDMESELVLEESFLKPARSSLAAKSRSRTLEVCEVQAADEPISPRFR